MSVNIQVTAETAQAAKAMTAFTTQASAGIKQLDAAGKQTGAGMQQMRNSVNAGKDAVQALAASARVFGAEVAPQLTFGISAASNAFKALSGSAKLGAAAFSAYALGAGVALMGWKAAIDSVRESFRKLDEDIAAKKAESVWAGRRTELLSYVEALKKAGKLSAEEARLVDAQILQADTPEQRAAISSTLQSDRNKQREQLEKDKNAAALELESILKDIEIRLLTGAAKEKAEIRKALDELVAKGTEAAVKLGISSQPLLDLANQLLTKNLAEVDNKEAEKALETQRKLAAEQQKITAEIRQREQKADAFYQREEEHAKRKVEMERERAIQKIERNEFLTDAEKFDQSKAAGADMSGQADPSRQIQQMQAGLAALKNQWGTLQQQIAEGFYGSINSAINSTADGITGLIFRTEGWRQKLAQIPQQILQGIVGAIIQMGIRAMASMVLTAIFGKSLAVASTAALIPIAAAQSAIWAAPAALSLVASYGGSASAVSAIPGIIGTGKGLALASSVGFKEGGSTGTGSDNEVAGLVHRNEFVMDAATTRRVGVRNLELLRKGGTPTAAGDGGTTVRQPIAVFFDKTMLDQYLRDNVDAHVVRAIGRNRVELGFQT